MSEVIAAFADGEPVDPAALDAALADPMGRAYLIDILMLRGMIADAPPPVLVANATRRRSLSWIAAAGLALVCGAGGFVAGRQRSGDMPGSIATGVVQTADLPPVSAPPATNVIQLEPGVDWTESRGGL